MASAPLALQWSLDQTAASTLSLSRGLVAAATSDNVQPLALVACERFGATLDICPETCAKVERLVETPRPVATFIGAYIGYSAGDCATQLVKSVAGVQFLALAAALVTTTGAYQGGLTLEALLRSTATDATRVPTATQLQAVLTALEPRCVQSRFADAVVYCRNLLVDLPTNSPDGKLFWKTATAYPDAEGTAKILNAFWNIKRARRADEEFLDIAATTASPWVIAFTKWCLGDFPSVYLDSNGLTPVFESSASHVTIIASIDSKAYPVQLSIRRELLTPADLVFPILLAPQPWFGMVHIKQYGQWIFHELDFGSTITTELLAQVLPCALRQVILFLDTSEYRKWSPQCQYPKRFNGFKYPETTNSDMSSIDENFRPLVASPFPKDIAISGVLSQVVGVPEPIVQLPLHNLSLLADLPVVVAQILKLREACTCWQCSEQRPYSQGRTFMQCLVERFFSSIAFMTADILALSLFEFVDSLLVSTHHAPQTLFLMAVSDILRNGARKVCPIDAIYDSALMLIGHQTFDPERMRILASTKGQVAYLKLFSTNMIPRRGYLTISWAPGSLQFQGRVYSECCERIESYSHRTNPSLALDLEAEPVTKPRNLYPNQELAWQVVEGQEVLHINLICRNRLDLTFDGVSSACSLLKNIAMALVLEGCQHHPDDPLTEADKEAVYSGPLRPLHFEGGPRSDPNGTNFGSCVQTSKVSCVAVNGDDGLRMLALGDVHVPMVIRGRACIACALEVCRKSTYPVLIL